MGTDVFALITEWEPLVADVRAARGFAFYWDAGRDSGTDTGSPLPYAVERHYAGGFSFVAAGEYWKHLRPLLPPDLRARASAFLNLVYGDSPPDDLRTDSGVPAQSDLLYALRPEMTLLAETRAEAVPWDQLYEIADRIEVPEMAADRYTPNFGAASAAIWTQRNWIAEAAAANRGIVVLISQ